MTFYHPSPLYLLSLAYAYYQGKMFCSRERRQCFVHLGVINLCWPASPIPGQVLSELAEAARRRRMTAGEGCAMSEQRAHSDQHATCCTQYYTPPRPPTPFLGSKTTSFIILIFFIFVHRRQKLILWILLNINLFKKM